MLAAWAILGMVLGAAATEVLRAQRPELVDKVEDAARRFACSLCPSKRTDEEAAEDESGADE